MATVRAKFLCRSVEQTAAQPIDVQVYGSGEPLPTGEKPWPRTFRFHAVYDTTVPEDQRYAKATPCGAVEIQVDNPAVSFEPGRQHYLDFTPGRMMASPLAAAQLVAALKAEGCKVRDWRNHNRNSRGAWGPVNGVMIHHTANGPGVNVVDLIYDGHTDLPGPLATGCITKDGTIHLTGNGRANHAGGGAPRVLAAVVNESYGDYPPATHERQGSSGAVDGNSHFYGCEYDNRGDGTDPWPRVQ
ncbi:N-acetylmuramoyl-L-alanine amidase [Streptomyces sp. bgisy034]|uniref:N-acetylmuramoyl-L-alanine amidase n=1 Tax=Streptomyces sp. bgisy034 TaxID=3413774 RepID=UPI003EBC1B6F